VPPTGKFLNSARSDLFFTRICQGATITGTVKDPEGGHFKGAFIEAQNKNKKNWCIVLSNLDGHYRVENLTTNISCSPL
jgi:hypothetical protein